MTYIAPDSRATGPQGKETQMFKVNEGPVDRAIRVVVGLALLAVALLVVGLGSALGVVLLVVGALLTMTGALGFCAMYRVLGINTCPAPKPGE
jgi:hypothetical protein